MNHARHGRLRVVILHGAYGRPDSNWFPWLAERVQAAGHEALLPRFPTPQGQSPGAWLDAYGRQVDNAVPRSRTILVAHSLGVAFALRLAARAGAADPYRGAFLAAGFWGALGLPDYDPINAPFFAPLDWADHPWRQAPQRRKWHDDIPRVGGQSGCPARGGAARPPWKSVRLYVLPGSCSLASHIALEAMADAQGVEQAGPGSRLDVVVVQRGHHREPDYLAVNPRGTVPALVTREGNLVVESLAVLLHIADQVPATGLAPPLGDPARDRLHGLLSFMVTTVHPAFQMLWRAERFAATEEARADVRRTAEGRIAAMLSGLEEELNSRGHLIGEGFSVADAYLFVLGRWGLRLSRPTTAYLRLWRFIEATAALPAARRAMEREGISLTEPRGCVRNLGRYAASWIAGWPNRPSSTAALT